jgi:aspartate kinase
MPSRSQFPAPPSRPVSSSRPVVMKFGGTSVADAGAIARLVAIARSACRGDGRPPVVVVSAMSGVTDRLLALAAASERREDAGVAGGLEDLWRRHVNVLRQVLSAEGSPIETQLDAHFADLRALLKAASILRDESPSALDAIASTGELLSSRIVAAAFESDGIPAQWIDARQAIVTDNTYTSAAPILDDTNAAVAREVLPAMEAGRLAVMGGFVGATRQGVTTTLGRGGSDYSAALVGAALDAREIQIWTDVDGMLTADPRVVDSPRVVSQLSFGEASELAYFGAKVLHPATILPAVSKNIPVRILNSRRPEASGTLITSEPPAGDRPLAAVACKRNVTTIDITSTRMLMAHGFLRRVFEAFERYHTSVDVVTTSEVSVSVTLDDDDQLEAIVRTLSEFADVSVERGMAILCAVGDRLRRDPRIAARVVGTLDGFAIRMVSQAASRRNVTIVLRDSEVAMAMSRLHEEFFREAERPAPATTIV